MTPERIAEFHSAAIMVNDAELTELCRLARLGLRVEAAPTMIVNGITLCGITKPLLVPEGKRVALVVLEDSK